MEAGGRGWGKGRGVLWPVGKGRDVACKPQKVLSYQGLALITAVSRESTFMFLLRPSIHPLVARMNQRTEDLLVSPPLCISDLSIKINVVCLIVLF